MEMSQCFYLQCYNKVSESLRAAMNNQRQCKLVENMKNPEIDRHKKECNVLQCPWCQLSSRASLLTWTASL